MTKARVRWYRWWTWWVLFWLVALSVAFTPLSEGFAGVLGALMVFGWWNHRNQRIMQMEAAAGIGLAAELARQEQAVMDGFYESANRLKMHDLCWFDPEQYILCKTCSHPIDKFSWENGERDCRGYVTLSNIYVHRGDDPEPPNNPYKWWFLKYNGYPLPPAGWNDRVYYYDPLVLQMLPGQVDPYPIMQQRAKPFYLEHGNSVWDMGEGRIPQWYVDRTVEKAVA